MKPHPLPDSQRVGRLPTPFNAIRHGATPAATTTSTTAAARTTTGATETTTFRKSSAREKLILKESSNGGATLVLDWWASDPSGTRLGWPHAHRRDDPSRGRRGARDIPLGQPPMSGLSFARGYGVQIDTVSLAKSSSMSRPARRSARMPIKGR